MRLFAEITTGDLAYVSLSPDILQEPIYYIDIEEGEKYNFWVGAMSQSEMYEEGWRVWSGTLVEDYIYINGKYRNADEFYNSDDSLEMRGEKSCIKYTTYEDGVLVKEEYNMYE